MKTSAAGIALIASFEGFSAVAYEDGGGVWTIGYGRAHGVKPGDTCTKEEALAWLAEDVSMAEDEVNRLVKTPLSQNEFDALVSFVYNVGSGNFQTSTLLARINVGDMLGAAGQFLIWDKIKDQTIQGLFNRRMKERDVFTEASCTA